MKIGCQPPDRLERDLLGIFTDGFGIPPEKVSDSGDGIDHFRGSPAENNYACMINIDKDKICTVQSMSID